MINLYQRHWNGQLLHDDEFVISADEKTSIQAHYGVGKRGDPVVNPVNEVA